MVELSLFSDWSHCSFCGQCKRDAKLLICTDCSCVAYHNVSCQKSHWKAGHKRGCKELSRAMLPLKELIRWNKTYRKLKKNNKEENVPYVWCWWESDNENGITNQTLQRSNEIWQQSAKLWQEQEYLTAMAGFQQALEPYNKVWPYISKSSGTNEYKKDDIEHYYRSLILAKRLLFCAYCELDGQQVDSARQRLVQCISITMTIFLTNSKQSSKKDIKAILNDAWMELMLSYEEVPEHRVIARHVANMAISTKSCGLTDPMQRVGYMASNLNSIPYTPSEQHPSWCRVLEANWIRILNEYNQLIINPLNFSNVGSGARGSGHDDHSVVAGTGQFSWKEYVLFGTGSKGDDSDAPFTKQLLRDHVPDAISLAEKGGGEVIFSRLAPRTHIKSHCGPHNFRITAHLGLVVPDSSNCQIRVKDKWHSWNAGKVLMFDDSFEHEVKNDTDETRAVLLIRLFHPDLLEVRRNLVLAEARQRKEDAVRKRYNCEC